MFRCTIMPALKHLAPTVKRAGTDHCPFSAGYHGSLFGSADTLAQSQRLATQDAQRKAERTELGTYCGYGN